MGELHAEQTLAGPRLTGLLGRSLPSYESLLAGISRVGRPGRELAVGLDLVRSTGLRSVGRRAREQARRGRLGADGGRPPLEALWRDAALELGAEVVELPAGFLEIRRGERSTRVWKHWVMLDDIVTARLALEKALVHRLLADAGLPVPEHVEFSARDLAPARAFLERARGSCVVKPVSSAGGTGTTPGVRTPAQLQRAALRAGRRFDRLLIEAQAPGLEHRLLFLDGRLLDVLRRTPPAVTGDGRSSIGELIAAENERRLSAPGGPRWHLTVDLDCVFALEHAGLSLSSVPADGVRVAVKTAINQNAPEDNESVMGELSEAIVREAALAASLVGVRLAGVDVITTDPTASLAGRGIVLEVNATPGLHYHYAVREPQRAVRVAVPILRALLEEGSAPHT